MKKSADQRIENAAGRTAEVREKKTMGEGTRDENVFESKKPFGQEILEAMNVLDEELLEICPQQELKKETAHKKTTARRLGWAAAAFCSLCLIGGSVVFAASRMSWHVEKYVDDNNPEPDMSRYYVELLPQQVSANAFTGPVREVENILKEEAEEDAKNGISPKEDVPRGWVQEFDTQKEAIDYVGFEGLKETGLYDWENNKNVLAVYATPEGDLARVIVSGYYKQGEKLTMMTEARIYTENWPYEWMGDAIPFSDAQDVTGQEYQTKTGKTGLIMAPKYNGEGHFWMEGYMVEEEITYTLHVIYESGNLTEKGLAEDAVIEVMHAWMDQF